MIVKPVDMESFVWDRRYLTGEQDVDAEHQELVRILNHLIDMQTSDPAHADVSEVLRRLIRYAASHFGHEEAHMAEIGVDPRHISQHAAVHRDFARQVGRMAENHQADLDFLLRFLTGWLAYHILGMDQAMARQMHHIRGGMSPAEAWQREAEISPDPATASLLQAMNGLYHLLAARNDALLQSNTHLESQVAERTKALSEANRQLEDDKQELRQALATVAQTQKRLLESEHKRAQAHQRYMELYLAQIIDGDPVPTLVIDAQHRVTHWNKACEVVTGKAAGDMVGSTRQWAAFYPSERPIMADLIVDGCLERGFAQLYKDKIRASAFVTDAYEAEDFFPHMGQDGRWLYFTAAPLKNAAGTVVGAIETLQDVTERHRAEDALRRHQADLENLVQERTAQLAQANQSLAQDIVRREESERELLQRNTELSDAYRKLSNAQQQLLQSERLASIGQLAAGVAHEINNPIGYVYSNLGTLEKYLTRLLRLVTAQQDAENRLADPALRAKLDRLRQELDLDFMREDLPDLLNQSRIGISRVRKIVQDLRDFSQVDSHSSWEEVDLHQCLESTLNIVANEIRPHAHVVKDYGHLPPVQCLPGQLNQVFLNLLINAAQAMAPQTGTETGAGMGTEIGAGTITLHTQAQENEVRVTISDTGCGMPPETLKKIFDPFFTTKPVGQGTGLGLSLAYGIIQQHHGRLEVESTPGIGTHFHITLPTRQPENPAR